MSQEPISAYLCIDDLYFSALIDHTENTPESQEFQVSDAKYAEELQFQEALMASVQAAFNHTVQETAPSMKEIGSSSASSSTTTRTLYFIVFVFISESYSRENHFFVLSGNH